RRAPPHRAAPPRQQGGEHPAGRRARRFRLPPPPRSRLRAGGARPVGADRRAIRVARRLRVLQARGVRDGPRAGPRAAPVAWAPTARVIASGQMARVSRLTAWGVPLGVVVLTALTFRPVLGHGLVAWDDSFLLVDTTAYRDLWWPAVRHAFTSTALGHYVPMTWLSFSMDAAIWGFVFQGFHLTNLVLHLLNALLLYAVGRVLLARATSLVDPALGLGAGSAALFFAVRPMRVEPVAWLTERRGVLSGCFALLSVLAYLRATRGGRGRWWALAGSAGAFLLALLSKESTLVLPLGLVMLDVYPL